jgi:hypothetical protein
VSLRDAGVELEKYLNPEARLHEVSLSSRRFIPPVKQEGEEHVLLCEVVADEVGAVSSPLHIDFQGRLLWGFRWVPWQFRYVLGKLPVYTLLVNGEIREFVLGNSRSCPVPRSDCSGYCLPPPNHPN